MNQSRLPYLNKVIIVGSLVRDPELRYTTANIPVANFRISSNKRYRDINGQMRDDVCYIGIVAWQDLAESCVEHLKRGQVVLVEGELKSRVRNDGNGARKSYIEIRADHIQFLSQNEEPLNLEENGDVSVVMPEAETVSQPVAAVMSVAKDESDHQNYDYEENTL
jgi:single-strand DNA-binding protein